MGDAKQNSTLNILVRNETFELSLSLCDQLIKCSSNSDFIDSLVEKENYIYLNVDPSIFSSYILYVQTGCFIRPGFLSERDLVEQLQLCGAPLNLIDHFERYDLISNLSSHEFLADSMNKRKSIREEILNKFVLIGLFISSCILMIDLYRQMFILKFNPYQEKSRILIILIYIIDSILFLYSFFNGIFNLIYKIKRKQQIEKYQDLIIDIISCLGILIYFTTQRPITNVTFTYFNLLWIFVHLCRSIRFLQIGYHLFDIQWCFYSIYQCIWTYFQTLIGLFSIFTFSGSMLFTIDMLEKNYQYIDTRSTILSAHETLFAIGYRNNPPHGYFTRLWTIISIYLMSSVVQILLWWFQTRVHIQLKYILNKNFKRTYYIHISFLKNNELEKFICFN